MSLLCIIHIIILKILLRVVFYTNWECASHEISTYIIIEIYNKRNEVNITCSGIFNTICKLISAY